MKTEQIKKVAVVQPKTQRAELSIEALMTTAVQNNVPVETLERLVELRSKMKAELAKEAFNEAMASFQGECPTIVKTKAVKTRSGIVAYKYAPIESIVAQVKGTLKKNGFSYSTNMELLSDGVKVSVKVTHVEGHSEVSEMNVPLGNKTDIMSASQVVAAAQTFAKRYAFCNAFGILTGDEDTDAASVKKEDKEEYDTSEIADDVEIVSTGDDVRGIGREPEIPADITQQKQIIVTLVKQLDRKVDVKDKKSLKIFIEDTTQFALTEANFPAIIRSLNGQLK